MAVTSTTASTTTLPPRSIHAGVNVAQGSYTLNAAQSTTVSDVILMLRVPDRAIIFDGYMLGTNGATGNSFKVGTGADDDALATLVSLGATFQMTRFSAATLPFQVSLSDDVEPKWAWVKVTRIAGSSTLTESIRLVVQYVMPGNL